jgi:lycopene beta-cyclase
MLHYNKMPGARIFSLLFKRNRIERIFRFLDNETSLMEELVLLNTLPQWPFMKAGLSELKK